MKIKELKEIINSMPDSMDEMDIHFYLPVGCCGDMEFLEGAEVSFMTPEETKYSFARFDFSTRLEGHRSCRQRADTLKQDREYWESFPSSSWGQEYLAQKNKENKNEG